MNFKNYSAKKSHNYSTTKNLILLFLLLISISAFSQKKLNSVTKSFLESNTYLHQLKIEKFFLHTNKTVYMPGEKVWFKAYVVNDNDNKPSSSTTNLHINVYDANKKLVSNHLFLVKDGTSHGDIQLDKELESGNYFIELTTQWNQNFENNSAITKIEVVSNLENTTDQIDTENNQDFKLEFFPESNLFLENIENTIAFTSKDNSNAINVSGDIIDDKTGIIVAKINSNYLGLGKFKLYNRPGRTYTAFVNYDGLQKKFPLPKSNKKGIVIKKKEKQLDNKSIDLVLKLNEATIQSKAGDYVFVVLHRNGYQNVIIPIKLKKEYVNYAFNILNENLFDGVNTISLFNQQNKPISEFSFYHNAGNQMNLNISKIAEEKDSLTLNFDLQNKLSKVNLSISILPQETKMYKNEANITSAFLIAPYLESAYNNLPEIITSTKSQENIEMLLMTNLKENSLPYKKKPSYQRDYMVLPENGMSIKGNVSANIRDLSRYKVMLSSNDNELLLVSPIGKSNKFSFENLYLKKPTKYKLALLDPDGIIIKTGFKLSTNLISYKTPSHLNKNIKTLNSQVKNTLNDIAYGSLPMIEDMILLEEANVRVTSFGTPKEKLAELGVDISPYDLNANYIHVIDGNYGVTVYDYLQRIGGIRVVGDAFNDFEIYSTRGMNTINGSTKMGIIIDGVPMSNSALLTARFADEFTAISVSQNGAILGLNGANGYVSFYTKRGSFTKGSNYEINKDIIISETDLGFDTASNYENKLMQFTNNTSRKYYGTIDWIPNFEVSNNNTNYLKFNTCGYKNFKLIVNGVNEYGNLVFKEIDISLNLN